LRRYLLAKRHITIRRPGKAQEDALPADALRTLALLQAELPLKKAAALAAEIHGVKKNALYKHALEQQGE